MTALGPGDREMNVPVRSNSRESSYLLENEILHTIYFIPTSIMARNPDTAYSVAIHLRSWIGRVDNTVL